MQCVTCRLDLSNLWSADERAYDQLSRMTHLQELVLSKPLPADDVQVSHYFSPLFPPHSSLPTLPPHSPSPLSLPTLSFPLFPLSAVTWVVTSAVTCVVTSACRLVIITSQQSALSITHDGLNSVHVTAIVKLNRTRAHPLCVCTHVIVLTPLYVMTGTAAAHCTMARPLCVCMHELS